MNDTVAPLSTPLERGRHGIFVLLRRLRVPLSLLIIVYSVSVAGFTLIPGIDPQGQPWRMRFLNAFYFVSFLGTTIGLGEIPYPFTDPQRLWATASIYATVVSWLYAIGALFSVLQDPVFKRLVHEDRVKRATLGMQERFYLVCGYDDTGHHVVRELAEEGCRVVIVDIDPIRVDSIDVEDLRISAPALCGDASDPQTLVLAGLKHPHCAAVLALTGSDFVNTKVALTATLLNPEMPVLCAARDHASHARMAAAGADHIINPFDTFAQRVATAIRAPSLQVIYESLTTQRGTAMDAPPQLPRGRWVLCGAGRFVRTLRRQLHRLEIETVIVDAGLEADDSQKGLLKGDPTDPQVLERAGVATADALVAGTSVDIDNLAIVLAARHINKSVRIVAQQTQRRNAAIFRAAPADLVMLAGHAVAAEMLRVIRAPQLATFLNRARHEDEAWAAALLQRMREVIGDEVVESWSIELVPPRAPTVCTALDCGESVPLRRLMTRPDGKGTLVHAVPLLLQRGQDSTMLPTLDTELHAGDRVLCCGRARARLTMRHNIVAHALPLVRADAAPAAPAVAAG
ncbi:MAG: NAD(P)-binding protein [Rubrivivax sp.]